jgi:hypothetical protein
MVISFHAVVIFFLTIEKTILILGTNNEHIMNKTKAE